MGEQDLLKLQDALLKAFPTFETLSAMVQFHLGANIAEFANVRNLTTATSDLVSWAEEQDRMLHLLNGAAAASTHLLLQATVADLKKKIEKQHEAVWYHPPSACETCFVQGEAPFVNRKSLRTSLTAQLTHAGYYAVMAVNGPPGTGKSHSLFLITYVARCHKAVRMAAIDLKFEGTYQMEPDEFTRLAAQQLRIGLKDFPRKSAPADKWVRDLESWLVGLLPERSQCWLVLDGFKHRNVPSTTRSLIHRLIWRASTTVPELRIILLDYPKPMLPVDVQKYVLLDSVSEITRPDLVDFFMELFRHQGRDPNDPKINAAVDAVLAGTPVPSGRPNRNQAISEALAKKVRELFAGPPNVP